MLTNPLLTNILLFLAGFVLLTGGAEFLVRGASRIAARMNISSVVIGLTVVAFGTSLPEFVVSLIANLEGDGAIAIGNIVGSNIANLGLILAIAALLTIVHVERQLIRREFPLLLVVSFVFTAMAWNGQLDRLEGGVLTFGLLAYTYFSYTATRTPAVRHEAAEALDIAEAIDPGIAKPSVHVARDIILIVVGLGGLVLGAEWLVSASTALARALGISELVIGLTLVALGTSLPELATTLVAVRRNEADIAVGNVVGSNIFNILFIGGVSSLVRPLPIPPHMDLLDFPVMIGLAVLTFVLALPAPHQFGRWKGALLLLVYVAYITWLFASNNGTSNAVALR